jgi:hypothetical protein
MANDRHRSQMNEEVVLDFKASIPLDKIQSYLSWLVRKNIRNAIQQLVEDIKLTRRSFDRRIDESKQELEDQLRDVNRRKED